VPKRYSDHPDRSYPHGNKKYCAIDSEWFSRVLDSSKKVAVFWLTSADTVTLVGYYTSVSAANTAAAAAVNDAGAYPKVMINWAHSDITKMNLGPVPCWDARTDLPSWIDEDPAY